MIWRRREHARLLGIRREFLLVLTILIWQSAGMATHPPEGEREGEHGNYGNDQTLTDQDNHASNGRQTDHGNHDNHETQTGHEEHDNQGLLSTSHYMVTYFHASAQSQILLRDWVTVNWQQMFGSCVCLVIIAVLYEGLKVGREHLHQRMAPGVGVVPAEVNTAGSLNGSSTCASKSTHHAVAVRAPSRISRILGWGHLVQTLLYTVQVWIGFCLMLVFMTFNIWPCLAVTLGAGFGYFLFAWSKTDVSDHHCN